VSLEAKPRNNKAKRKPSLSQRIAGNAKSVPAAGVAEIIKNTKAAAPPSKDVAPNRCPDPRGPPDNPLPVHVRFAERARQTRALSYSALRDHCAPPPPCGTRANLPPNISNAERIDD
jgi:hypothetical protein